jgi:hypothetical protein
MATTTTLVSSRVPKPKPTVKVTVTFEHSVYIEVLKAAENDGVSVSAWLRAAARRALRVRDGLAEVAEWEAEHGALKARELGTARQRLGANTRMRRLRPSPGT